MNTHKEITMRLLIFTILCLLLTGCTSTERYTRSVNLPRDIYTQGIDPNDGAYSGMMSMSKAWEGSYGNSERSLSLYNFAVFQNRIERLETALDEIKDKSDRLETTMNEIKDKTDENDEDDMD